MVTHAKNVKNWTYSKNEKIGQKGATGEASFA
jgi:hypothetical protein